MKRNKKQKQPIQHIFIQGGYEYVEKGIDQESRITITSKEYINKKKFPLTTQDGLNYEDQKFIDGFNWVEILRRMNEEEAGINVQCLQRISELQIKMGRSFLEDLSDASKANSIPREIFIRIPCKKCGSVQNLHNHLCVYCDRSLEMETGKSEGGDWYRKWGKEDITS